MESIDTKDYTWMRNDYLLDHPVTVDGFDYPTVEHAYQAAKTYDENTKSLISSSSMWDARNIGRNIDLPVDWDSKKYFIMSDLILQKFKNNKDIAKLLLETGDAEIEMITPKDSYWGCTKEDGILGPIKKGMNNLGEILMATRTELKLTVLTGIDEIDKDLSKGISSTEIAKFSGEPGILKDFEPVDNACSEIKLTPPLDKSLEIECDRLENLICDTSCEWDSSTIYKLALLLVDAGKVKDMRGDSGFRSVEDLNKLLAAHKGIVDRVIDLKREIEMYSNE